MQDRRIPVNKLVGELTNRGMKPIEAEHFATYLYSKQDALGDKDYFMSERRYKLGMFDMKSPMNYLYNVEYAYEDAFNMMKDLSKYRLNGNNFNGIIPDKYDYAKIKDENIDTVYLIFILIGEEQIERDLATLYKKEDVRRYLEAILNANDSNKSMWIDKLINSK